MNYSADPFHAFILGINLYEMFTENLEYFRDEDRPLSAINLEQPQFQSGQGVQIKELIKGLIAENPEDRTKLADAREILYQISKKEPYQSLERMEGHEPIEIDPKIMFQYQLSQQGALANEKVVLSCLSLQPDLFAEQHLDAIMGRRPYPARMGAALHGGRQVAAADND